ncbi:putative phosphoglycerate mutase family protein [Xylariaceae sp. FL0594]|nr:putative phosphoglycerate mutase family protein [Xylariaceae sp. FL0594]
MHLPTSALLLLTTLAAAQTEAKSKPKPTVYLIRHGEKPSDDSQTGLSPRGEQRAQCLRSVFGAASGYYNVGYILAQTPEANGQKARPYLTVQPLADDLGLAVDTSCDRDDAKCVKDAVEGYMGQGNILICWEHKQLNNLAEELGAKDVDNYPDDAYDLIWTQPYDYDEITSVTSEDCPGLDD